MALPTPCLTEGAIYETVVLKGRVACQVILPFKLNLSQSEAEVLEAHIHNAMELVLAPYFVRQYNQQICEPGKSSDIG